MKPVTVTIPGHGAKPLLRVRVTDNQSYPAIAADDPCRCCEPVRNCKSECDTLPIRVSLTLRFANDIYDQDTFRVLRRGECGNTWQNTSGTTWITTAYDPQTQKTTVTVAPNPNIGGSGCTWKEIFNGIGVCVSPVGEIPFWSGSIFCRDSIPYVTIT